MSNYTKLLCLVLKAQKTDKSSEQGYAMAMVSIITIILFSLVVAATTFTNMAKSRTNAFVDSSSAFYVAEAGLNKRAAEINKILKSYAGVMGTGPTSGLTSCLGVVIPSGAKESDRSGTDDLECVNYRFNSSNDAANVISGGDISLDSKGENQNTYVAYTFIAEDTTKYVDGKPTYSQISAGDFSGLKALQYNYKVSATGKKPIGSVDNTATAATAATASGSNVTLSMTFTNTVVPLFQFGIFYDGDLEVNPTSDMQINGRVHSNAKMYLQPAGLTGQPKPIVTFLSKISASDGIYNGVDAWAEAFESGTYVRTGITRVLLTGTSCAATQATPTGCLDILDFSSATAKLVATDITPFGDKVNASAPALKAPTPGFTRKRNYNDNKIGEYFAKADMRLEMVPDRDIVVKTGSIVGTTTDMGGKTETPYTRNKAIIPFNFTSISTRSASDACTTATPTAGRDPVATYVDRSREKYSNLKCNVFTKGQLQSLRQPVMVLTEINQTRDATTTTTPTFKARESTALGKLTTLDPLSVSLTTNANTNTVKLKIIRALQVAIASTPTPISIDNLKKSFDDSTYLSGDLATFKNTFLTLIRTIPTIELDPTNDIDNLLAKAKPTEIAALRGAWFLPAPIQRIERPTADTVTTEAAKNLRGSGFYDGREERWITMLQTNIASLSVWNRDGLYVEATTAATGTTPDATLTTAYQTNNDMKDAAFNSGAGANFTDGLAFNRVTTFTKTGSVEIYPVGSLQYLGLGASDQTEGGLIFHATVNDDLDGSGGSLVAANDVTVDKADTTQRILKKNRDGTNATDDSSNVIVLDYYRKYPNQTASRKSPFAFAFNGGNYLPGAMTLSSDQSIYIQGNFNNNNNNDATNLPPTNINTSSSDRLPAAIIADTITVLSNQCLADVSNPLKVPSGQLSCGLPTKIDNVTQSYGNVTSAIAINAAFLANTEASIGNKDRASTPKTFSGGANNYIRLLEDWFQGGSPLALNYYGSLIGIGAPVEYSGAFRSGGRDPLDPADTAYFNVPFRNINYDTKFDTVTQLPPLTPKASYVRQSSFSRTY